MVNTVNILGDTAKKQWLNAIDIYSLAIGANVETALNKLDEGWDAEEMREPLEAALRVLDSYTQEMKRLVEGVFDD